MLYMKKDPVKKVTDMGCCSCFGFSFRRKPKNTRPLGRLGNNASQESLLDKNGDVIDTGNGDNGEFLGPVKRSEEILSDRFQKGLICREVPVKETHELIRSEDEYGNKTVNEYVREHKIGSGSYGKVVLYRSSFDGKYYALKSFRKSHLLKLRVAPSETAMTDVLREVLIMKSLCHPNIVNLVEVINDLITDHFYMVLEYVEGESEGAGPPGGLGENTARKYLRDIVSGLMYLHAHDEKDDLRRSPGTPVFTAPECCLGLTYRGRAADTWAVGVTLYYLVFRNYPFLGDTLQNTYDKIINNPLHLPDDLNPLLKDLIEGLLCKEPTQRMTLEAVSEHPWVVGEEGSILQYQCWCKRNRLQCEKSGESTSIVT